MSKIIFLFLIAVVIISCERQESARTESYIWRGVINHKPIMADTNVIYLELPQENWVYYNSRSQIFHLYTGHSWIVLKKVFSGSMTDSLNIHKTNKIKGLL